MCIGATMNSGKSYAAAACCYALSSAGKKVRAAKITGTASLKDILLMQDSGAQHIADFSSFGFPSTYMLNIDDLLHIFRSVDAKYGNNSRNYLVFEFADGILQRETAKLLQDPEVRDRIHKLIFCASDASGIAGGLRILKESFDLIAQTLNVPAPKLKMPRFISLIFGGFLSMIAFITKVAPPVSFRMARIGCEYCYYSPEKAIRELEMPQSSLEDAIRDSLAWFMDDGILK